MICVTEESVPRPSQERERLFAACLCLLATVLLYAPLAGAAWSAHSMACCTGDHCPIPQHHHKKAPAPDKKAPASAADPNCGHGSADASGITACSMSCCQNPDRPAIAGLAFVLTGLTSVSDSAVATRTVEATLAVEIPRTIQPLSPPPRFA
jgi:hypothetical protein